MESMGHRVARLICLLGALLACAPAVAQAAVQPDGSLLLNKADGKTYRVVGGAPLHIASGTYTEGCKGRVEVANLNGYRTTPSDGAMIFGGSDGGTYRFAGGAPLWLSKCTYGGGCAAKIQIDDGSFKDTAHLKTMPLDATVIRNVNDGGFYRFAGGAPLLVRCDIG